MSSVHAVLFAEKDTNQRVASHYVGMHFLSPLDPDHHSGLFWFKQIGHSTIWGTFAEHLLIQSGKIQYPDWKMVHSLLISTQFRAISLSIMHS